MAVVTNVESTRDFAVRIDENTGVREEVGFFGTSERLFGCRYRPPGEVVGGVVVCSSILADFMANYQREVMLARLLAERGFAVQRFHYRGTGNSDGDPADGTFERLCDDAHAAVDSFKQATGSSTLALLGTRWGALVAAEVASSLVDAPLVLWEPTLNAGRYFRDAYRSRLMREVNAGVTSETKTFNDDIASDGWVDLLGYPVHQPFYDSVTGLDLETLVGTGHKQVLVVQMRKAARSKPEFEKLESALTESGHDVEMRAASIAETWWFHDDDAAPVVESLLDQTADWLLARMARRESR